MTVAGVLRLNRIRAALPLFFRARAKVAGFNREKYKVGPKFTEGWLSRVQQLAPVVAATGTIDISVFAKPAETKAAARQ